MLITNHWRDLNAQLHADDERYGTSGHKLAPLALQIAQETDSRSVLDYGCGKGQLGNELWLMRAGLTLFEYDPAIVGKQEAEGADLVVCSDVMEHVEESCVDAVIDHIFTLAGKSALFLISLHEGDRRMPDGSPAHCTVKPVSWWLGKINRGKISYYPPTAEYRSELVCEVRL